MGQAHSGQCRCSSWTLILTVPPTLGESRTTLPSLVACRRPVVAPGPALPFSFRRLSAKKTPRNWEDGASCRHRDGGAPTSDSCRVRVTAFCCLIPPTRVVNTQTVLGYGPGRLMSGGVKLRHCQGGSTGHCLYAWPERDPARADPHHRPTMSSPPPASHG